ncbi:FtsQ-type POTRA domain-containing protein [Salinicoccus sp. ID82-1]|uniref:Cell division protein DivIB n=1 Tax=Salinicoccus cyprini TaxID=2493691 RepID=A0A558AXY2_9STAP|nr:MULTISPECIES: FtsQ-type POTRA domain-containing protein [Salinicoccus]MCG1008640.1 FtsQ-type POTRA domain-containing protein [Salinicoccus sp. ID82-1]TVT29118.1 FtsQ-type POTRA domain-containing protein [Salinicoccus cyprini]
MSDRPDIEEMKKKLKRAKESDSHMLDERLDSGSPPETQQNEPDGGVPEGASDPIDDEAEEEEAVATFHSRLMNENRQTAGHYFVDEDEIETFPREDRQPERKRRLPRPKFTRAHFYILLLLVLLLSVGTLIWYVFSSASDIKTINISGNELISDEEVQDRLHFDEGTKMFSADLSQARENIALLPAVQSVELERKWWSQINVTVTEYRALGYVANNADYYPVLENAQILRGYPSAPKKAPILHYFEGREFNQLVENLDKVDAEILEGISEIYYRPSENSSTRIHMFMNDGQEIVADYRTIDEKMNYYPSVRKEIGDPNSGVIDFEIGSSFLPYGSQEAEEVKAGIYETPVQAKYIEDVNQALADVRDQLTDIGGGE